MELPLYFSGMKYKKSTRPLSVQQARGKSKPVSKLLIASRLTLITEDQIIDIGTVGLLGNHQLSHSAFASFLLFYVLL